MDTQTLVQNLRDLVPGELEWRFALYSIHKSRDGAELEAYSCKMRGIPSFIEAMSKNLLEKTLDKRAVTEYSPFLPKENIGAMPKEQELIQEQIKDLELNVRNSLEYSPEDFVSGALPIPKGYIFYGYTKDEEGKVLPKAIFMKRTNPFLLGTKARLCMGEAGEIAQSTKPLLKFTYAADFIMLGDFCYFLSPAIEKDFGLESRQIAICAKRLSLIAEAGLVGNYERFEQIAFKNARKFLNFDKTVLAHIEKLSALERDEFLGTYGITIDMQGRMETDDDEQAELVIDLLCCRSCLDPLGRLSVGNNIMPR